MRQLSITTMVLLAALGCRSDTDDTSDIPEPASVAKAEIIVALESPGRTLVYIALWTLEKSDITVPTIDFDKPYAQAQPHLKLLAEELSRLPDSRLAELDKSFAYHRQIYSPIWTKGEKGWDQ